MNKVVHVVLQLPQIGDVTLDTRPTMAANVQGIGGITCSRNPLGHHVHAAAGRRRAMHQHHASFIRDVPRRVISKGEPGTVSRHELTDFRQIGEVNTLEWVTDARHGRRLAWAADGDRQSSNRQQNRDRDENADEKTLHANRPNYNSTKASFAYFGFSPRGVSDKKEAYLPFLTAGGGQSKPKLVD